MTHSHNLGILSNREIRAALKEELIVIHPFQPDNVNPNSYDVTLGEWFYRESNPVTQSPVYNIYCEDTTNRVWGQPQRAMSYKTLVSKHKLLPPQMTNINPDDLIILLGPGETILAHTVEFIGGRTSGVYGITTEMSSRSSIGRSLLGVCKCAGLGDAGYINRWTMEITSFSQHHWIPLVVGRRVAQIEFKFLSSMEESYTKKSTKYQSSDDLDEIVAAWKPEMMLPRLYQDRELHLHKKGTGY